MSESPNKIEGKTVDYEEYYRRIKLVAQDRAWTQEEITQALKDRELGERKYLAWFNSKGQNYKLEKEPAVVQRMIDDASRKEEQRLKLVNDKILKEQEEALKLANSVKPKGEVRSYKQFYEEQIQEQLKIKKKWQELLEKKQEDQLSECSPTPKLTKNTLKIVNNLRNLNGSMNTSYMTARNPQRDSSTLLEYQSKMEEDLLFKPQISSNSRNSQIQRSFNDVLKDTSERMARKKNQDQ